MESLRSLFANMTPRGRMMLGASVVGTLVLTFLLMKMAGAPTYDTVAAGLNPADTGKLTAALDEKGISYKMSNNGTSVSVQADQVAQAKITIAEKGLTGSTQPAFDLFDKQKLGSSDFQQQVTYQRALEGELANTIMQVNGISGAQVQLVLPQEELFDDEASAAKAAVLLSGTSDEVDVSAIKGVANLVSSSVKGLKTENVTITDATGKLLWPTQGGDGAASAGTKMAAETRYSRELEASLGAMLAQSIGPGKAVVRVSADLNVDQATKDQLVYGKKAVPISAADENESLKGGSAGASGASGASANIPSYAAGASGGSGSNYTRKSKKTEWAVDKTVTRTQVAPGKVNKLNVALMVDSSVPASQLASLKSAVAASAGIDPARGDVLSVSAVKFAKAPTAPAPAAEGMGKYVGYAKWAALALALLAFMFFMTRHLKRREREDLADPVWLRELTTPRPLAALEASASGTPVEEPAGEQAIRRVREAAEANPDRIAQQVRAWMHED